MNEKPSNPWSDGLLTVSLLLLLPVGVLTFLGVLVAMALGADLSGGPEISKQAVAIVLLSVVAILVYVLVMAARWDTKHRERR